ncbi:hypothetical protein NC652_008900 [Populus alba x Populus x berolinensis]|nr:hypothetical protein NC652_008898 [Populus alba x Populus x berolinensis]KAJ6943263.1 hypothetical protein NC652_008900 [Populus alba x Populus x berolinensis]
MELPSDVPLLYNVDDVEEGGKKLPHSKQFRCNFCYQQVLFFYWSKMSREGVAFMSLKINNYVLAN